MQEVLCIFLSSEFRFSYLIERVGCSLYGFDNIEGMDEQEQITWDFHPFISSNLKYCRKFTVQLLKASYFFTVLLLTMQEISQNTGRGYFV